MSYTTEELNTLTGTRAHRKATVYETLKEASSIASKKAARMQSFMVVNVLDYKGSVVASFPDPDIKKLETELKKL